MINAISYPYLIAWVIGAILSVTGFVNIAGPRRLREAYARWEFPTRFYLVVGALELTAAALLAMPELRSWGIGLTGFIIFGAVVTLFNHRHYMLAVPGVILMVGLVPVSLAVPHETHQVHYVNTLPAD
ncbi:MAG TPA: DoxX family protein [Micropepsaceae bacterium]|nr:DoxX family protein [Micropepsaceae bacterium]